MTAVQGRTGAKIELRGETLAYQLLIDGEDFSDRALLEGTKLEWSKEAQQYVLTVAVPVGDLTVDIDGAKVEVVSND